MKISSHLSRHLREQNSNKVKKIKLLATFAILTVALIWGCKKEKYVDTPGVCPVVVSTTPINGAVNVPFGSNITVTFNEEMNAETFTNATFTVTGGGAIAGTISYSGLTAVFTPSALLSANTTYSARVTTLVKDKAGNALQADYVWSFSTGAILAPTVTATDPVNNATGVPLSKIITAKFSVPMNATTINAATFTVKQGTTIIPGIVSYTDTSAMFVPTGLFNANTVYTATITTGAKNLAGTPLANNYVWSFTTFAPTAPTVILTDPLNNATNVALNKVLAATFSVPMDPATINTATFTVTYGSTPTVVPGTVFYSGNKATFTPTNNLLANTVYTATITTGAKNTVGTALAANYVWTFTTETPNAPTVISTDPLNNATGVTLNKVVTATFSTVMDPITINGLSFTVMNGTTPVAGIVTYTGTTASFTPTSSLIPGTVYTATISTIAQNMAGTPLASNYVWSFTTLVPTPPTVISTDPLNNAINVPLNKIVTATFSTVMDPATINGISFTVKNGTTSVPGVVTYTGTTASFTPTVNLLPNTLYTATITTAAKNMAGTALTNNYVWSFTTMVQTAPIVVSTEPVNNETNVLVSKVVNATFNMAMDQATINSSTFTLKQGVNSIVGIVSYTGNTAYFTPFVQLNPNTVYTATITTGAKNLAGVSLANNYVWSFTTKAPTGGPTVDLGTAARFGILAGVGVSNNAGFSEIRNMDVGIYPGVRSSVTGFPPAIIINGAIYASDDIAPPGVAAMLSQAKQDLTDAYLFAEAAVSPAPVTVSGDQGGLTLAPGIYKSTSTLSIQSGNLTLDAQGDPNAVWIFQIASGFTTVGGAGGSVILIGGAQAKNIFWQTGSSATLGSFTSFQGNILALTSITMGSGATATGRMLARNGAVVMTSTNIINKP